MRHHDMSLSCLASLLLDSPHKGLVMQRFDAFFVASLKNLMNKWSSCQWIEKNMIIYWNDQLFNKMHISLDESYGILLIGPLGTNCSEIWIEILTFSFKKINVFESVVCEMAAILSRPQCVKTEYSLNILTCKKHELVTSYPNVTNILSLWARENIFSWIWNCYSEHKIKYEYDVMHNVVYVLSEFLGIRYPLYLSWCL